MYGAPSALSPGSGPVYPYGSFTTQPLQGAPVYPGSQYAAFQTPHLYGPSGAANLTSLPQAYGGAGSIPTSTPTAGSVTYLWTLGSNWMMTCNTPIKSGALKFVLNFASSFCLWAQNSRNKYAVGSSVLNAAGMTHFLAPLEFYHDNQGFVFES